MALQLISKDTSEFIQNLLSEINSTIETIDSFSDIEVVFEDNPEYTQFKLIDGMSTVNWTIFMWYLTYN